LLFEGINASKGGEPSTTEFNAKRALNREEWVSMLLQVALACYVVPGKVSVVEGVRRLFTEDICPKVNSSALHEANSLREEHCYKEVTDLVLRKYEKSLRAIFEAFAFGTGAIGDACKTVKMMDFDEYMDFVSFVDVVDDYLTLREIRLAFLWARMVVIAENTVKGRSKTTQLQFEDWLEILVRLAHQMALPTDAEISDAGLAHAGEFLMALRSQPDTEDAFKQARGRNMDQTPDQPIEQKVKHLIHWIMYAVRGGHGSPQEQVSVNEASKFAKGLVTKIATPVEVADLAIKQLAPAEMESTAVGAGGDNDVAAEALIMPWAHDSNDNDVAAEGLVPNTVSVEISDDVGVEPRMESTAGDVEVQALEVEALAPQMHSHVEVNDVEIVTSAVSD